MRRLLLLLSIGVGSALPTALAAQLQITARGANVTLGGRFQVQYSKSSVDGGDTATTDAVDDIFVRRGQINLELRIGDLEARLEPEFAVGNIGLADGWIRWRFGGPLRISVGQFKRAFSIFELHSDVELPWIERDARIEGLTSCPGVGNVCSFSRFAGQLQFDERDVGVRAEGDLGSKVQYLATLTNGQGRNLADVNDGKSVSGRIVVLFTPTIKLAGYAASHDYLGPAPARDTEYAQAFGADLEIGTFRDGFHLLAGVIGGENWLVGPTADFNAIQGIASYYVPFAEGAKLAGIEPMLRVDRSWTENATDVEISSLILTPGISFYVSGRNWLGINFDHYDPSRGETAWSLKTQFYFYY
jgi:hypothetical protein